MQHPTGTRGAYWALAFICLVWGTTYLVLRIGVLEFPPFLFTSIRQLIAGSLLTGFMLLVKRELLGSWANIGRQALAGVLMICLGNGLVGWAEVYVPSGIASLLCSLMPVWVIVINMGLFRQEPPNRLIIIGVLLGMAGMLLVFRDNLADFSNPNYTLGIVLIMVAVVSWAAGSILVKHQPKESHPILNAGLQMFFGGAAAFFVKFDIRRLVGGEVVGYGGLFDALPDRIRLYRRLCRFFLRAVQAAHGGRFAVCLCQSTGSPGVGPADLVGRVKHRHRSGVYTYRKWYLFSK